MSRPSGDDLMLRTAARRLTRQTTAVVAAAMLLVVGLVSLVVVRGQAGADDTLLRRTAASADDVGDPPPGSWLVLTGPTGTTASPGLPGGLTGELARLRRGSNGIATLTGEDAAYRVATAHRPGKDVQVVLDLRPERVLRAKLLAAAGAAALLSLLLALAVGSLLGRRAVQPLGRALTLQRAFVADASHELRTPLTLLSTRVQVLARTLGPGRDVLHEDIAGVVLDVQRLAEVVDDLLVAADPRRDDAHEPVDIGQLVEHVVGSAQAHATHAGVAVGSTVQPVAGVIGSPTALRRAVLSLVDNAVDHTPPGGTVQVTVSQARRSVLVTVTDSGPGVAPEAAEGLLRRFASGGSRAGRAHYGLGLALAHDVADRHGGHLRLVPTSGGASFELALPIGP